MHKYSHIVAPLTALQSDKVPFIWTPWCEEAFETFKQQLCQPSILQLYEPSRNIRVQTDSSNHAIGIVLLQEVDNCWHPVAYKSCKLTSVERNYPVHEKLLALIYTLKQWRVYLLGRVFAAQTDHKTIIHLLTQPHLSGCQARWVEMLADYNVDIQYVLGVKNIVADVLSHVPEWQLNSLISKVTTEVLWNAEDYRKDKALCRIWNDVKQKGGERHLSPYTRDIFISKSGFASLMLPKCDSELLPSVTIQRRQPTQVFMVVIDCLSKMAHFVLLPKTADAMLVTRKYLHRVFCHHGLQKIIVSDRDPKFTSLFWTTLFKELRAHLNLSSAHHHKQMVKASVPFRRLNSTCM